MIVNGLCHGHCRIFTAVNYGSEGFLNLALLALSKDDPFKNWQLRMASNLRFQVEEYYERLEVKEGKKLETKRVYVASDDPKVLSECRKRFTGRRFSPYLKVYDSSGIYTGDFKLGDFSTAI